jgi:CDGSH-type Zn-finger protein
MASCEYIGPNQKEWPYTLCGCQALAGKSYCGEHYWAVYKKGSATAGRRAEKEVEKEIAELKLQQEIEEMENTDV